MATSLSLMTNWDTLEMEMSLKNVLAMASIPQMMHYLTLVHSKLAFWGSLGHFPAPKQPKEPLSGPLWIPITTQHVSGLVLNMIMSPKQSQFEEKCVWFGCFCHFYSSKMSLLRFCLFLTDPKHHLGTRIHSTHQELQFERKRSFLAQFVQEIWAKPWHKLYQKCQKWPPPSWYSNPLQFFFGGSFSTAKANLKISTSQATLMLTFSIPRYKYSA